MLLPANVGASSSSRELLGEELFCFRFLTFLDIFGLTKRVFLKVHGSMASLFLFFLKGCCGSKPRGFPQARPMQYHATILTFKTATPAYCV